MTTLTRLTEAEYNALKNEVDAENGAGFALYRTLSVQSNVMGAATPLAQRFADNLLASYNNRLPFDRTLPSYITYSAVFDEYEAATPPPTPARNPRVRRPAAPPAPAGAGSTDHLGVDWLDDPDDFVDAPIAPVTSRRSAAARFAPPAAPEGEPTIADVFTFFGGIVPTIDDHADMLDEHEAELFNPDGTSRLDQLEDAVFGGPNPARPWARSTSSATVSDGDGWLKLIGTAVGTLVLAFLVTMAVVGIIGAISGFGPIAAIATWLWLITLVAVVAAVLASIWTYRSTTASAVTREERI